MAERLRVVVAGAGAVGSVFGGWLAHAGHDVLLVGREAHMAAVRAHGLELSGLFGACAAHPEVATDLATADRYADLVLVSVKSHATESVAATLGAWRHRPPLVVSLQNGLGNVEALSRVLGAERVLGGRVIFGALLPRPGEAHVTVNAKPVALGPLRRDDALQRAAVRLAGIVVATGIPAEAVPTIEPVLWEKALYNCGLNPLGALHGLSYGEVAASPELRRDLDAAMDEGFRVARAAAIELPWPDGDAFRAYFYASLLPPTARHRSSMRQDLEAGRRTEIDAIGGAIVRIGARVGVATPVNRRLVAAVHDAESRAARPG
jgi:2-dehydropantoate 2-reductase